MTKPDRFDTNAQVPLFRFLTYRILRVHSKLNAQAIRILGKHTNLTLSHWRVVAMIGAQGETSLSEISRLSEMDKGQVSRSLKALTQQGMILAQTHESDHRQQRLSLSPKGQAAFEDNLPRMRRRQRYLMSQLEPEELAALYSALEKLELAATWEGDTL